MGACAPRALIITTPRHSLTRTWRACADYLTKVVVKGKQSAQTKVEEVMTPQAVLITVTPEHSVLDVMALMMEKNFRHVPVVSATVWAHSVRGVG